MVFICSLRLRVLQSIINQYILPLGSDIGHRNTQEYSDKKKINDTENRRSIKYACHDYSIGDSPHKKHKCSILDLDTQSELNTDIDVTSHLHNLGELHRLLSGVLEVLNGEDLQARLVDELVGLLHVGTLQTGDDGGAEVHLVHDVDETLGDGVAADDTTEDVDEDRGDLGVAGDQLEGALDGLGSGTTADVEEVGGGSTVQLDDVHGGHGETGTVD